MTIDDFIERDLLSDVGTFVSLYSGAGGMDIGFYKAGFRPVWSNDNDPSAVETYQSLFKDHEVVCDGIENLRLPDLNGIDLVIGGPPCQGFSVAGKMDPNDVRNKHVMKFLQVVKAIKPRAFIMENVWALAVCKKWEGFKRQLIEFSEGGPGPKYKTKVLILNAADYGVPQYRERMFIVGLKEGHLKGVQPTSFGNPSILKETLKKLPAYMSKGNDTICLSRVVPAKNPVLRKSPYAGMLFNGHGRPFDLNRPALTLPASMGGNRTPIIDQNQMLNGGSSWIESYHERLLNKGKPLKRVPNHIRRITVEEAALIQSFPIGIKFAGSRTAQFRQIGNSVPPDLAYHLAVTIRESLFR